MKSRTSSRPQRRLTKLSKDTASSRQTKIDLDHGDDIQPASGLICASYESLTPENRQRLREQFTATFPEASSPTDRTSQLSKWASRDNLSRIASMGRKERAAKSASTLMTDLSPVEGPLLSPTLSFYTARPTQAPETIDVEAAISLLQELRKKASPEELVALHRALLPVKEIDPVSADSYEHDYQLASEYRRQFASKRRSNMPPGLATRGGPEDDPLRRYSDIQRRPVPKRTAMTPAMDDLIRVRTTERPQTPVDSSNGQAGVYRTGTLRITNGCASPVSSMHYDSSYEIEDAKEIKIMHTTITTLDLVKELDVSGESSDESNTIEHGSPWTERSVEERHFEQRESVQSLSIIHPTGLKRTNTAMRNYNEFLTSPYDRKVSAESQQSSANDSVEQQFVTPKASIAEFPPLDHTPEMPSRPAPRPELSTQADSGYASEGSSGKQTEPMASSKAAVELRPARLWPVEDQRWLTALPSTSDAERSSLYTFEQIVKSPSILGATTTDTSSPQSSKPVIARRQTLFSSLKLRSPSSKTVETSIETADSIETVEIEHEVEKKSKRGKSKKLKKATPHHIKQARKELKRLEEAARAEAEAVSCPVADPSSRAQTPAGTSVQDNFKVRAPQAYARIQAASAAFEQQQAQRARSASYTDRELQNALSEDVDATSVVNFGAVARSLGAGPYDVSTRQFSETIDYIEGSENSHRIQSPFEIGHGMGMRTQGMDEKAASEFARSKSRDYEGEQSPSSLRPCRKPVSDYEMPPLPPLPTLVSEQHRELQQQTEMHTDSVEQSVLVPSNEPISQRRFPILDGPVTTVDWEPQARIWRERREALNAALQPEPRVTPTPQVPRHSEPRIEITKPVDLPTPTTPPSNSLKVDTAKITQAQAVLADARAAINQRVSSPVSPIGDISRHSWTRPLSPVSDLSTSTSETVITPAPRGPRPPSRSALSEVSSGRFPADYLARLNAATPPQPSRSAPPAPARDRPISANLSLPERPTSAGRPLSAVLTPDRYSGGFQYEWQRDVGVMGSAGTRVCMTEGSERSKPSKVAYGLDFSDIPLFVEKTRP